MMQEILLYDIAYGRSGDKGNTTNIGIIARKPEYYPILLQELTEGRVLNHFSELAAGPVERFELPNLHAVNFLVHNSLDGGGTVSLRTDAQGKTYAAFLLRMKLQVDASLVPEAA